MILQINDYEDTHQTVDSVSGKDGEVGKASPFNCMKLKLLTFCNTPVLSLWFLKKISKK